MAVIGIPFWINLEEARRALGGKMTSNSGLDQGGNMRFHLAKIRFVNYVSR